MSASTIAVAVTTDGGVTLNAVVLFVTDWFDNEPDSFSAGSWIRLDPGV